MGLRRYVTYLKNKVLRLSAGPHAIAAGFASGAAVSIFPFIGFHFLLGFVLAYFVRGNMLAAALGTAVGNPITFPFIFSATYHLGGMMIGALPLPEGSPGPDLAEGAEVVSAGMFGQSLEALLPAMQNMIVGAVPLSLLTFLAFYWLVQGVVRPFQSARRERLAQRAESRAAQPQQGSTQPL